jgi:hypothetical protein
MAAGIVLCCGSCSDDSNPAGPESERIVYGEVQSLGNGTVRTSLALDSNDTPLLLSTVISKTALEGLPGNYVSLVLTLPEEASATPYKHVYLNWNPQGHDPSGIYTLPHFDVHFYTIPTEEREQITADAQDSAKISNLPPEQYRPADYVPDEIPGVGYIGIPLMGLHWTDPTSPEFNGEPFTETFIYGSYDGSLVFWEPMVTVEFLEAEEGVVHGLKLPQEYEQEGYFPTEYRIQFDSENCYVQLGGLTLR